MKKLSYFPKLLNNNRFLMVFSFALAVVLWFVVSVVYSPQTGRTVSQIPVEITFSEQDAGYQIYSETDLFAKVEVTGKKYEVERLGTESFVVSATVDKVNTGGMYTLDLVAKKKNSNGDYTILSVSPSTVNVMIDLERESTFDVSINCVGATIAALESDSENLVLDPAFTDEKFSTVTVSGPDSEVRQIARVEALADVNQELSQTQRFDSRLVAYDVAGAVVYDSQSNVSKLHYLTFSYDTAEVVANVHLRKTVPLKCTLEHAPAKAPNVVITEKSDEKTETVVNTVSIVGDRNLIEGMKEIVMDGAVDFSKVQPGKTDTYRFPLQLPTISGVEYDGYESLAELSEHTFTATLELQGYTSKTVTINGGAIKLVDVKNGCTAKVNEKSKRITVVGPYDQISALTADSVVLKVDLSSAAAGTTVTVAPSIQLKNCENCWIVGSYTISADVMRK